MALFIQRPGVKAVSFSESRCGDRPGSNNGQKLQKLRKSPLPRPSPRTCISEKKTLPPPRCCAPWTKWIARGNTGRRVGCSRWHTHTSLPKRKRFVAMRLHESEKPGSFADIRPKSATENEHDGRAGTATLVKGPRARTHLLEIPCALDFFLFPSSSSQLLAPRTPVLVSRKAGAKSSTVRALRAGSAREMLR